MLAFGLIRHRRKRWGINLAFGKSRKEGPKKELITKESEIKKSILPNLVILTLESGSKPTIDAGAMVLARISQGDC